MSINTLNGISYLFKSFSSLNRWITFELYNGDFLLHLFFMCRDSVKIATNEGECANRSSCFLIDCSVSTSNCFTK